MNSHGLSPVGLRFDGRPGTGMSDINFLIADVIKLLTNAEVTFSQAGATDLPETYSVPGLYTLNDRLLLFDMRHLIITNPFLFTFSCFFTSQ